MNDHISKTFDDGYKYRFSVIIPVYNVEDYLEETILSVINQTMDFKSNIQLILINDGSKDDSYKVCKKFKDLMLKTPSTLLISSMLIIIITLLI